MLLLQITSADTADVNNMPSNVSPPAAVDSSSDAHNEISVSDDEVTHFSYKSLPMSRSCFFSKTV